MKFLIQAYNGEVEHDFSFTLIQQIKDHNHFNKDDQIEYRLVNHPDVNFAMARDFIPVGSVEFVTEYLHSYFDINYKPVNIPKSLNQYRFLLREVEVTQNPSQVVGLDGKPFFAKSNTKIKGFADIVTDVSRLDPDEYLISEIIDIDSEWRGFVHRGELLDIRNYSGDPFQFPSITTVRQMISEYKDAPVAYTIDVAVLDYPKRTVLIECHDFFSCGLYGFNHDKLPWMFSQAYYQLLKKHKK